jgi:hypothetical protein
MRLQKSPTEPNKEPHLIRLIWAMLVRGVLGPLGGLDVRLLRAVRTQLLAREHPASASRCVEAGAQVSRDPAGGRRAGGGDLVQQHEIVDQAGLAT